jgi:hypothetical protein
LSHCEEVEPLLEHLAPPAVPDGNSDAPTRTKKAADDEPNRSRVALFPALRPCPIDRRSPIRDDPRSHDDRRSRSRSPITPTRSCDTVFERRSEETTTDQNAWILEGVCRHWNEKGRCLRGDRCPFRHPTEV